MNLKDRLDKSLSQLPINAKELAGIPPSVYVTASDQIQGSSNAEVASASTSYVIKKTFTIYRRGNIKIKFQAKRGDTSNIPTYKIIRYNGISETEVVGATNVTETSYTDKTHTIEVDENDIIRIYLKDTVATHIYLQNLKICFDINKSSVDYEITLE